VAAIAERLVREVWPHLSSGRIRTVIQETFPLEQVAEAQAILDANAQLGKVGLLVDPSLVAAESIVH
jgi:NADPH:quinone reductase